MSQNHANKRIVSGNYAIRIFPDNSACYEYEVEGVGALSYTMLCECGAPYQPALEVMLKDNGLKVADDLIEYDAYPWCADKLVPIN